MLPETPQHFMAYCTIPLLDVPTFSNSSALPRSLGSFSLCYQKHLSILWLIVLSPYWTFQISPPVSPYHVLCGPLAYATRSTSALYGILYYPRIGLPTFSTSSALPRPTKQRKLEFEPCNLDVFTNFRQLVFFRERS
jgi:hypothetical protein